MLVPVGPGGCPYTVIASGNCVVTAAATTATTASFGTTLTSDLFSKGCSGITQVWEAACYGTRDVATCMRGTLQLSVWNMVMKPSECWSNMDSSVFCRFLVPNTCLTDTPTKR